MKRVTDGISYEAWCADYLHTQGYKDITLTKASGDQGIDILARKGRTTYGFQCKFYSSPVGNTAVQEAFSGAAYYNCDQAAVLTNTTFTKGAKDLAEETGVELWEKLVPYDLHAGKIRIFLSLITTAAGITLFFFCVQKPAFPHRITAVIASLFLLAGSLLRMYRKNETGRIFLSLNMDLLTALLLYRLSLPLSLSFFSFHFLLVLSIVSLFHLLLSLKERSQINAREMEAELQASIREETEALGKHLSEVFTEETGRKIILQEASHEKGISRFTFHAFSDIREDLALLEYSFNQTQKGSGSPYRGQIKALSNREFTFTLTKD